MHAIPSARLEQRLVAGIAAAMLAAVVGSFCVIQQQDNPTTDNASVRPFWSADATASNLAVVELQRSGTSWGQGSQ